MAAQPGISIELVEGSGFDQFFQYLNDHLGDNGEHGLYFQPVARSDSSFLPEKEKAFRAGLGVPVGNPGWRKAWIARGLNNEIVGHIDLRGHPERFAPHRCLLGMGVHRDHRRRGYGSQLLGHAERWAVAATSLQWIDLQVLSNNAPAVDLYHRAGFTKIGEIEEMFIIDGKHFSYTLMAKQLVGSAEGI